MDKLKPCPFCGGSVRFDKAYSYFRDSVIYCDDCDMVFTLDDCQASDDEICAVWNTRYLIEYNVEMKDCWIPCSERLPGRFDSVLLAILSKNGYGEPAYYVTIGGMKNENEFESYTGDICECETVTHWMPIPEPPESEAQHEST